jgi:putative sterol carrier protein
VRLVQLQRIRVSNVDSMMRNMPHYFRGSEAGDLRFTCLFELTGESGGEWVLEVADRRCRVTPGRRETADLTVRCDGALFLRIHRGETSAVPHLLLGRIRLGGDRRLFLTFPRIFPVRPPESAWHRLVWRGRRWWRQRRR